jgi:tetratricopeptide (TPR) repeat protein
MQGLSASRTSHAGYWWISALTLGLAFACYWPALHGQQVWDDDSHITRPELQSVSGLREIWFNLHATQQYYPLLHSAFWVEHRLWGDATLGYHLTNVLLHATAAVLLVLALRRLRVPGAWLAGLIFTVHPVCVESVAWISEQKNTLSLVLYLLAALAYLRFDGNRGRPRAGRAYLLAFLLFTAALMAKTVTATLPAALLVVFWWKRGRLSWRRDTAPLIPWFVLSIASGVFSALVERKIVGAEGAGFDLTLIQRCLLAGRVIWFYLGKLLWPFQLSFIYPRWDVKSAATGWTGYLTAAALATAVLWLLHRRSRGPLAAWLFFVGSLFPALGFFNVFPFIYSYVADHFQYLACIGIITAASAGAALLLDRAIPAVRAAGWGLIAALVATFAILSNAQSRTYADQPTLYKATIERNPDCWMAYNNLGVWYQRRGNLDEAIAQYSAALRIKKDYAAAHDNLGTVLLKMPGRLDEATAHFQEALRLQPDYAEAHNELGVAWLNTPGRLNDAIAQFQEVVRLSPDFPEGRNNLGDALLRIPDRTNEAIAQFVEALRLRPSYAEAHSNLGTALYAKGRMGEAVAQYKEALRLKPGLVKVHYNIALALLRTPGGADEAEEQLEAFLKIMPDNEMARRILAQIRANHP